jgi:hypothetical protein
MTNPPNSKEKNLIRLIQQGLAHADLKRGEVYSSAELADEVYLGTLRRKLIPNRRKNREPEVFERGQTQRYDTERVEIMDMMDFARAGVPLGCVGACISQLVREYGRENVQEIGRYIIIRRKD